MGAEDTGPLHAGAIAVTDGWPPGDREVERVNGVSIAIRAMYRLEDRTELGPFPRITKNTALAICGTGGISHGRAVEVFDGAAYSLALLDAVRDTWPGVAWVPGTPRSLVGWNGRALYGYVGKRCVAVIAQMKDEPVEDVAS